MEDSEGCAVCGGGRIDAKLLKAFKKRLCFGCKSAFPLITQSTAIEEYLLSKGDLAYLPKLETENPRSFMWKPMLLYSKEEVERISKNKFPDLEKEKERRKTDLKERKTKRLKKKIASLKRTTQARVVQEDRHEHEFAENGTCACGMEIDQEEI